MQASCKHIKKNNYSRIGRNNSSFDYPISSLFRLLLKTIEYVSDVAMLGGFNNPTPASDRYVDSIQIAAIETYQGDPHSKGDLLIAHAYVRYLADAFGGSMLGKKTNII